MKPSMQMLCRLLPTRWTGAWLGVCALCWVCLTGQALAALTPAATPLARLQQETQAWVARTQSIAPEQVSLAPLDPRLQVQACAVPLAMDLPFASPQTVRVRCAQPAWQLYVRVTSPLPAVATAQPMAQPVQKATTRAVLVAAVPLQRGMPVGAHQVEVQQIDAQGLSPQTLEQVSEVLHAEMARDVRAGAPISRQDVRPRVLVKRGQMVLMSVGQSTGFQITARVQALQDGRYGEQIKLKNTESGRSLSGLVMGPNQVQGL